MVYDDGRGDELYRLSHGEFAQMHSIRIAAVFVIATATIAGIAGGGGLGEIMANQVFYTDAGVLAAAFVVAAMALATAGVLALAQHAASRRTAPRT